MIGQGVKGQSRLSIIYLTLLTHNYANRIPLVSRTSLNLEPVTNYFFGKKRLTARCMQ